MAPRIVAANCTDSIVNFSNINVMVKPFEALKRGPIQFEGRESVTGGRGGGVRLVRFTISLKPETSDNVRPGEIIVSNAELGTQSNNGTKNWMDIPADIFKNSGGTVMFIGSPFERIQFGARYLGKPLVGHYGRKWQYEIEIAQDIKSKLIFFRFLSKIPYAKMKDRVFQDDTYLCEPVVEAQ